MSKNLGGRVLLIFLIGLNLTILITTAKNFLGTENSLVGYFFSKSGCEVDCSSNNNRYHLSYFFVYDKKHSNNLI